MTESRASVRRQPNRVPIQERAFSIGNITGINSYRANRVLLKQRLTEGGYQIHETEHFLLFTRTQAPSTILAHWFPPEQIDANLGDYFLKELKPLGILKDVQSFGEIFGAVVFSLFPYEALHALHLYGKNTLRHYQCLLKGGNGALLPSDSTISRFAQVYRRVCQLLVGETFLDVGCSFGFLPLLISEMIPALHRIVGIDIQTEPFVVVRTLAEEQHLKNVHFLQGDVLVDQFDSLGHFDTVVALHVLEHFSESDMYRALTNLLQVTTRRLLLAVPYEPGEPEKVYGHQQLFTPSRLEALGEWCLEQLDGEGRMFLEECAGGLLLLEKKA